MEVPFAGSLESHYCCPFLSRPHLPPTTPFFFPGSRNPRELWRVGRRARKGGEKKRWRGVRAGVSSQQRSQRGIWGGAVLCALTSDPDHYSHSVSSTNEAGNPATEPGQLLLGTITVPVHPVKVSVWGGELVRVFYPQGSDYKES